MKLIITAKEALDYNWWQKICDIKGFNVWALKEGLMDETTEITLTDEEMEKLGVLIY